MVCRGSGDVGGRCSNSQTDGDSRSTSLGGRRVSRKCQVHAYFRQSSGGPSINRFTVNPGHNVRSHNPPHPPPHIKTSSWHSVVQSRVPLLALICETNESITFFRHNNVGNIKWRITLNPQLCM